MTTTTGLAVLCRGCGAAALPGPPEYCAACGFPYEVHFGPLDDVPGARAALDGRPGRLWKYAPLMPVATAGEAISLGEGGTPLAPAPRVGEEVGILDLWCKLDHLNPSGSFKDRSVAVGMAHAIESGMRAVVCASSGNAGGSAAMYAARAGIPALIFVPASAPTPKLALALEHGARVVKVEGDFSAPFQLSRQVATAMNFANLTTTYINAFLVEGNKSVAYEVFEQLGRVPDWVTIPVSAGPLLEGVRKGFAELVELGLASRLPRLAAIQPKGCAPIAQAFDRQSDEVSAWRSVDTIVSGLNDPLRGYAADGTVTLKALRETGGVALAVDDREILAARRLLARKEGMFVEPAAATSVAGLEVLRHHGRIGPRDCVVCLLTGHGFKQPMPLDTEEPPVVNGFEETMDVVARMGL